MGTVIDPVEALTECAKSQNREDLMNEGLMDCTCHYSVESHSAEFQMIKRIRESRDKSTRLRVMRNE